jgi:hypothetical protein
MTGGLRLIPGKGKIFLFCISFMAFVTPTADENKIEIYNAQRTWFQCNRLLGNNNPIFALESSVKLIFSQMACSSY